MFIRKYLCLVNLIHFILFRPPSPLHVCEWTQVNAYNSTCMKVKGQPWVLLLAFYLDRHILLVILVRKSNWSLGLWRPSCSCLFSIRVLGLHILKIYFWFLCPFWGFELRFSSMLGTCFYPLSHLSSSSPDKFLDNNHNVFHWLYSFQDTTVLFLIWKMSHP